MSVIETNVENFENDVLNAGGNVLVDFWAPWCGPCQAIAPILDEVAKEKTDLKIVKVNVDNNGELAVKYGVRGIPTMIMFNGGEILANKVGAAGKEDLLSWIDESLND